MLKKTPKTCPLKKKSPNLSLKKKLPLAIHTRKYLNIESNLIDVRIGKYMNTQVNKYTYYYMQISDQRGK